MGIIRADLNQLDSLAELFDRYRQFYEQPPDPGGCRKFIAARLQNNESVIFAARDDGGELLGFTQLYRSFCSVEMKALVYLYDLYVSPGARRQGVARDLMEAARQFALSCGAGRLQLETAVDNYPGQALYEDLGWKKDKDFFTYHLELPTG